MKEEGTTDKKAVVQFLTIKEISERLKLSPKTVAAKWRLLGGVKILGSIRFDWERTLEYIRQKNEEETMFTLPSRGRWVKPPRDQRRRKTIYELIPDRHGLLDPPRPETKGNDPHGNKKTT